MNSLKIFLYARTVVFVLSALVGFTGCRSDSQDKNDDASTTVTVSLSPTPMVPLGQSPEVPAPTPAPTPAVMPIALAISADDTVATTGKDSGNIPFSAEDPLVLTLQLLQDNGVQNIDSAIAAVADTTRTVASHDAMSSPAAKIVDSQPSSLLPHLEPTPGATKTPVPRRQIALGDVAAVPKIDNKDDVRRLQEALRLVGLLNEEPDGIWGAKTGNAIKAFETSNALNATGKPGRVTWPLLHAQATTARNNQPVIAAESHSAPEVAAVSPTPVPTPKVVATLVPGPAGLILPPTTLTRDRTNANERPLGTAATNEAAANLLPTAEVVRVDTSLINEMQSKLDSLGYSIGTPTGNIGPKTSTAIRDVQQKSNLPVTGKLDAATVEVIRTGKIVHQSETQNRGFALSSGSMAAIDIPREIARIEMKYRNIPESASATDKQAVLSLIEQANASSDAGVAEKLLNQAESKINTISESELKGRAHTVAQEVEDAYKRLRNMYSSKITDSGELGKKVTSGYETMMADLNRGNFTTVVERGPGFKNSIDRVTNDVSKNFVSDLLKTPAALKRMSKGTVERVANFHNSGRDVEAAELALKEIKQPAETAKKTSTAKKSSTTTNKRTTSSKKPKTTTSKSNSK